MMATFALDEKNLVRTRLDDLKCLNRHLVINESMAHFIEAISGEFRADWPVRAVQIDLDLVYSERSTQETRQNLDRLIERLVKLKINTVFLQAFADPDGDGTVGDVYFNNRHIPVRADLFAHAAHQIQIRGMKVFAWMPVLSFRFPDDDFNRRHGVMKKGLQRSFG